MMGITPPDWCSITDFDEIIACKRKDGLILGEVRSEIDECYKAYREQAPEFAFEPQPFSIEQRRALQDCYKANLRVAACTEMLIRLQRLYTGRNDCPLCGISEHSTWDHYLPQAMFPEFAVCVYNLVRACSSCNEGRKRWRDPEGRLILHMYYDNIVQEHVLLDARVDVVDGKIQVHYQLQDCDRLPPAAAQFAGQFARHCGTLGLLDRFAGAAVSCLYDHVDDLRAYADPATIQTRLQRTAQDRARRYGTNHWRSALFRGAASSASFLEYILQKAES